MYKFSPLFVGAFLVCAAAFAEDAAPMPTGDAANGEKIFGRCKVCHTPNQGGPNRVGPNLWGIVGKGIAENETFKYSPAYQAQKGKVEWDEATLFEYLKKPNTFIKGTRMAFPGLPKPQDRADLIAYLKTLKDAEE
jgi:cytochrome c